MRLFLLYLILILPFLLVAQNKGKIMGHIVSEDALDLEKATVSILNPQDSTVLSYTLTDAKGKFEFIRFDKDSIYRVFNRDANCFDSPFITEREIMPKKIIVTDLGEQDSVMINNWCYSDLSDYNEFILVYNKPKREYEDFIGEIKGSTLKLSNYGGDIGYPKHTKDTEWDEILSMKEQYNESLNSKDMLLVNKLYATFVENLDNYNLDGVTNQYIIKNPNKNVAYFENSPYQDNRYLRKYVRINLSAKDHDVLNNTLIGDSTLFYSTCDSVNTTDLSQITNSVSPARDYRQRKNQRDIGKKN